MGVTKINRHRSGMGQSISFSHMEHTGEHFQNVHLHGSTNTTERHDSERTTLQYCTQIGFGQRPVLQQVLCHCWFPFESLSFSDESELQRRELTISSSLSLRIRTAVHIIITGIILQCFLPLKRYMGIKYLTHSDQGMSSDPSHPIIFLAL